MFELFSERNGHIDRKTIQFESLDEGTRNRILNLIRARINAINRITEKQGFYKFIADRYFKISQDYRLSYYDELIEREILTDEWHKVFSFVEFFSFTIDKIPNRYIKSTFEEALNDILVSEKTGYRLNSNYIISITDENELETIKSATNTRYNAVNTHLKKALKLYADRLHPDYENSIKESISAVESIACIIVENDKAVLSSALDKLVKKGVRLHRAQIEAYKKLYGYTSDENGIRHAGIDFNEANAEDAKYMLVSCSAFVYYLIEKYNSVNQ